MKQELKGINNETVIHCPTEELANQVLKIAHEANYKWYDGMSYMLKNEWRNHKDKTCYNLYLGSFSSLIYFKENNYEIISAKKFIKLNNMKLTNNEQLGAVYLKKEGLDIERFKSLVEGMGSNCLEYSLNNQEPLIENWERPTGDFIWTAATKPDPNSKLITLNELEELLFPKKWCINKEHDPTLIGEWFNKNSDVPLSSRSSVDYKTDLSSYPYMHYPVWGKGTCTNPKPYGGYTEITLEQFKKYILKMETKFKIGDRVKIVSLNGIWNNTTYNNVIGEVGVITEIFHSGVYILDNNKRNINFYKENLELLTEEIMYKVTREQLAEIYDIACTEWKPKIIDITFQALGNFGNEGTLDEKTVESMRIAATSSQRPVIDKIFPKPKVKKSTTKYDGWDGEEFQHGNFTDMFDNKEKVSTSQDYPQIAKITVEWEE